MLDRAAALLRDVWAAAAPHGVQPDRLRGASACLDAVTPTHAVDAPKTEAEAAALLRRLVVELEKLGELADFDMDKGRVQLGRTAVTPSSNTRQRADVVAITTGELDGGWLIGLDQAPYVKHVIASYDQAGAAAVAKLASQVNNGRRGVVVFSS